MDGMRVYWYSTALLIASGLFGAAVTLLARNWYEMVQTIQDSIAYGFTHPVDVFMLLFVVGFVLAVWGLFIEVVE